MDQAFEFIISNGGITETTNYKYTARDGTCKTTVPIAATLSGYEDVPAFDEDAMVDALTISTLSVGIAADCLNFQLYSEGVFDGEGCDPQVSQNPRLAFDHSPLLTPSSGHRPRRGGCRLRHRR